ncbi:Sphingoid long-chain base transporter RSB1 [Diplodia seriata]|uniref:Sphingoid long-chain base transporter RSB1 n=1 Tax=Diplodia seriata TaxID=420778 RepID=A0A1S8BP52_9PEZI|nr:Sphingoid long-chain base transporter RSB1 [Diplodia seriata]
MDCTLETCPVSASIYGYRPSIPANAFFVALFGTAFIVQFIQGVRYRTWTYTLAMMCGCFTESIGHAGRIMLHDNPFGQPGFNLQICTLTLAPAFLAAAVYLMLKHLVLATSPSLSRFPARYYTYIFITCDLISLVLQAAGGGTAATSDGNMSQLDIGDHMMMAGLVFQVFTLVIFGAMSLDFAFRSWRAQNTPSVLKEGTRELRASSKFKVFVIGLGVAFAAILARCIYRIIEMAGGWKNPVMQDEVAFIVLDST